MNISEEIINVLEYLGEQFGVAIDWSSETVLPMLKQLCEKYIAWEIMTSIIWLVIGGLLLAGGMYFMIRGFKVGKADNWDCDCHIWWGFALGFGGVAVFIGTTIALCQIFDIVKCCYFPELQVYQYIRGLISPPTTN